MELRRAVNLLASRGLLDTVDRRSVIYQIARELKIRDGKRALLVKEPILPSGERSGIRVVGGIATSRETISAATGLPYSKLRERMKEAIKNRVPPSRGSPLWKRANLSLHELPILKHYQGEPGRYLTSSIVIFRDESGNYSASYHRMLLLPGNRVVLRAVEGRKLHRTISKFREIGEDLPVAVSIGSPVDVMLASAMPAEGYDKLSIAGAISGRSVPISPCEDVDAWAPSESEIVLCGRITGKDEREGPFYEILGKDIVRRQPVMEVDEIHLREGAIYQAILPASREHELLMGMPVEPLIMERVSEVADVVDVAMTPGGGGWIEVAISIRKENDDQPALVGLMAISAHKSLKKVIVVDEDVNVNDYVEVMKAVVQRAHLPDDYKFISGVKGSSLDHSNLRYVQVDGEIRLIKLPQGKLIIDATKKGPKELFEPPVIPE